MCRHTILTIATPNRIINCKTTLLLYYFDDIKSHRSGSDGVPIIPIFSLQETHEQLAERKGLHVVEFRPENTMRPAVVASPSPQAAKEAEKQRTLEDKDYDFDDIFDPYKGAHRPRKVKL